MLGQGRERRRLGARGALALSLALGACGGGDDPHGDDPCTETNDAITCPHHTVKLSGDVFGRAVHFKAPTGAPPDAGWPVVIAYQGSFHSAGDMWSAKKGDPFGGWNQTHLLKALVDAGFLVLTPEAHVSGSTYWDTNVPPWDVDWGDAPDNGFVKNILRSLGGGKFRPADLGRVYATGISSGGYMTSRMALSYEGQFRALAIESASFATCGGALCDVPDQKPSHPPTLFLHGEKDEIVPLSTMRDYQKKLQAVGVETDQQVDPDAGHQWLDEAPQRVPAWFLAH